MTLSSTFCLYQKAAQSPSTTDKELKKVVLVSPRTNATVQPNCRINGSEKKNRYAKSLSVIQLVWWRVRSRLKIVLIKSNLKLNSLLVINNKIKVELKDKPGHQLVATTTLCSSALCRLKKLSKWPKESLRCTEETDSTRSIKTEFLNFKNV